MGASGSRGEDYGVGREDVVRARERIAGLVVETPLVPSRTLSRRLGREVRLKLEIRQPTGSFKVRGAANAILALPEEIRRRGVVAQSSGNHGRAVAWVARELGIPAAVFLPETVPEHKVEAVRALGARVVATRGGHQASIDQAIAWARERERTFLPPFDHPHVIAGQGTAALEIFRQWPEADTLVVPLSGGGLLSGMALVAVERSPAPRMIGVSMAGGAMMVESLRAGRMTRVPETPTLADALAGELPLCNRHTFRICRDLVDETATVEEEAIRRALHWVREREGLEIEGAAAVGVAWLLGSRSDGLGDRIVVVLTGGNVAGKATETG